MTRVTQVRQVTPLSAQLPSVARTKTRSALSVLKEAGLPHGHRAGKWALPRWEVSRDKLAELAGQLKGTRRADGRGEVWHLRQLPAWPGSAVRTAVISFPSEASAQDNAADLEPQLGVGDEVMLSKYGAGSKKSKPR